jgi:hypothetical protein
LTKYFISNKHSDKTKGTASTEPSAPVIGLTNIALLKLNPWVEEEGEGRS